MSRIRNIIARARDTLADPNGERWSDDRLLRIVSEGHQDIAKHTQMLKAQIDLSLLPGQRTYELPSDLWVITRASFADCVIEMVTHEQMDALARKNVTSQRYESEFSLDDHDSFDEVCWETATSSVIEAIVYDKRNLQEIVVYPIPDENIADNSYTFEAEDVDFVGGELYGVVTDIDEKYTFNSPYGVVTELYEPSIKVENFNSPFGVVTGINESKSVVRIWYIAMPAELETLDDELLTPAMWDTALKFYLIGHAFDDDYDTRFAEKSAKALALYDRELKVSNKFERQNNVRSSQRRTIHRGPFD